MLLLSRRKGEEIMVGDDVRIVVMFVGDGKVQIGIDAPKEVKVHRLEIYEAIQRQEGKDT